MEIRISLSLQRLDLLEAGESLASYSVSTADKGPGEQSGSHQTPRGSHIIRAKIGGRLPINTVFVSRRATGEIYSDVLQEKFPNRDWILTRILWLSGCEVGKNRLGSCDTMRRYIYIHGCPDSCPMGTPLSHGCIRMRNNDIIELFERVPIGAPVIILE